MAEAEVRLGVTERHIRRYIAGETAAPKLVDEKVREIADGRNGNQAEPAFRGHRRFPLASRHSRWVGLV